MQSSKDIIVIMNVEVYERVVDTFFDDGVVNKGRIIVLYCLAKVMGERFPNDVRLIWDLYQRAIRDRGYPTFEDKGRIQALRQESHKNSNLL